MPITMPTVEAHLVDEEDIDDNANVYPSVTKAQPIAASLSRRGLRTLLAICALSMTAAIVASVSVVIILQKQSRCIQDTEELYDAIDAYFVDPNGADGASSYGSAVGSWSKYGDRIGLWCVSRVRNFNMAFQVSRAPRDVALKFNEDISQWDVSGAIAMEQMFYGTQQFNGNLSTWDVSRLQSARSLFNLAAGFNSDLSQWNVSALKDMSFMFKKARRFNGDLASWDTSSVNSTRHLFFGSNSFNSDISQWNVHNVRNMSRMFYHASSFNGDVSRWNVAAVQDMYQMFRGASNFSQNLCAWGTMLLLAKETATPVVRVRGMFRGTSCPNQTDPDLSASPPGPFCFNC